MIRTFLQHAARLAHFPMADAPEGRRSRDHRHAVPGPELQRVRRALRPIDQGSAGPRTADTETEHFPPVTGARPLLSVSSGSDDQLRIAGTLNVVFGEAVKSVRSRYAGRDPAQVHKDYARARKDYRQVLLTLVSEQNPGRTSVEVEQATRLLLALLG